MTAAPAVHAGRAHSELGASGMSRWAACPASVALLRGRPNRAGHAAERGTAVHELAEHMLRSRLLVRERDHVLYGFRGETEPTRYIGWIFNGIEIDEEMAECAGSYVDRVLQILRPGDRVWIERRFDLAALDPPAPMFGTADLVVHRGDEELLIVVDLKSGAGVVVQAEGNPQLRYYALGALLSLPDLPVRTVGMVIIQPLVPDPVKREEIDAVDLLDWSSELMAAAHAAMEPGAPTVAGGHCRFCGAKPACPAYERAALEAARDEFDVIEGDITVSPPDPAELSSEDLARRLFLVPLLKDWIRTIEAFAFQRLSRGDAIPGWKLVARQSRRKWRDDQAAVAWMHSKGLTIYDAVVQTPISPAQAEKLIRKGRRDLDGMSDLVTTDSSGLTLAPESDRREPARAVSAADDFDVIEHDNEEN